MKRTGVAVAIGTGILAIASGLYLVYLESRPVNGRFTPLASLTFEEYPPHSTQNEASIVIEAVLDLEKTGLQRLGVDGKARMAWVQGQHRRRPAEGGTLVVEGTLCRMRITLSDKAFREMVGFLDYDPVLRIGLTLPGGVEHRMAGVLQRKQP